MRNGFLGALVLAATCGIVRAQNPYGDRPVFPPVQVPMYGPDRMPPAPTSMPSPQMPMYGNNAMPPATYPPRPGVAPPFAASLPSNMPYPAPVAPYPPPRPVAPAYPPAYGLAGPPLRPLGPPPMPAEPMVMLPDGPPADRHWFPRPPEEIVTMPTPGTALAQEDSGAHPAPCGPDFPTNAPIGYCCYGSADFLYGWMRRQPAPALLSIGPNGQPGSTVVGNPELTFENQQRAGGRFNLGTWLNCTHTIGLETTFLFLAPRGSSSLSSSKGDLILDRPFFDTTTGTESQLTVAGNGSPGSVTIDTHDFQFGGDLSLRFEFIRRPSWHFDWLLGFKYYVLQEDLNIAASSAATNSLTVDRFATTNTHLGPLIGIDYEGHIGSFYWELWGKFSLGQNSQQANISGDTTTAGATTDGGFLAQPSNIGNYYRGRLDILPEAGFNVGFAVSEHLRLRVGYHIIYLNNVVRPGAVIDRNLPNPAFTFNDTTYWMQNFVAGFEFRY
jgi:hypothetical protein